MVFAREISDPLTSLVKKIDEATVKNKSSASFFVFLSDEEGLKNKLVDLAKKQDLKKTVLSIDNPSGPPGYGVSKDADVTVILYEGHEVKYNLAYRKGEFNQKAIDTVLTDLQKMLSSN